MRRLPLRLLVVALALAGLVLLADLEQRALRREADRTLALAVAGYLRLAVPAAPHGDYAADRLVSTINRLQAAAFWHAGLEVDIGGTPVLAGAVVPSAAARVPLDRPSGTGTVGTVMVWEVAGARSFPAVSWILAVATLLAAGLATTRRAGWLWPLLGLGLLGGSLGALHRDTERVADGAVEATMEHLAPMAGLLLLDRRRDPARLAELGAALEIAVLPGDSALAPIGWRSVHGRRQLVARVAQAGGVVVELALPPAAVGGPARRMGVAGGALVLLLAMLPPIRPRRRPRAPGPTGDASIPG